MFCVTVAFPYITHISVRMSLILMLSFPPPVVYLIIFHLSFVMFVWSYWKTIFTKPANPSKEV